jgi:hypothetical protein
LRDHDLRNPLLPHGPNCYDTECRSHEKWVILDSSELHRKARWRLVFKKKHKGRALSQDIPELGLKQNDRLVAIPSMLDTMDFDKLSNLEECPALICFWRPTQDAKVHHRNPLLDASLGIGITSFSIDEMHCVHLGIMKVYIGTVFWRLLLANIFGLKLSTQDDLVSVGLQNIMILLAEWYPKERDRGGSKSPRLPGWGTSQKG